MGDATGWWPYWLADLGLKHEAIMISPNYRFLPGATSTEIYDDIDDFWKWLHSPELGNLLQQNPTPVQADISRILTTGESAGGLLTLYTAFSWPDQIRATVAAYPSLSFHPDSEQFTEPLTKLPMGTHVEKESLDFAGPPGEFQSSLLSPEAFQYMLAVFEYQTLGKMYARGSEGTPAERLYPFARLEKDSVKIPQGGLAVFGSYEDSLIPVHQLEKFVERSREVTKGQPGNDKIVLSLQHGEHGFDMEFRLTEQWIQDLLKQAVETWLA